MKYNPKLFEDFKFSLPEWLKLQLEGGAELASAADKMNFVVALSQMNIENGGGPFAAAIFNDDTGELVSVGVNQVLRKNWSVAHAEMVAITMAQNVLSTHDFSTAGNLSLFTSSEPCAMCMGAIPWSGLKMVYCGAFDEDVRQAGFDEGAKPGDWISQYEKRGIKVELGLARDAAVKVLKKYQATGAIY